MGRREAQTYRWSRRRCERVLFPLAVELRHELGLGVDQPEPRDVDGAELEDPGVKVDVLLDSIDNFLPLVK